MTSLAATLVVLSILGPDGPASSERFDAPKYGVKASIPKDWPVADRETGDRVFVALIRQGDGERPGVAACEIGLAPESLDEYRSRIEANALKRGRPGATLAKNEVVKRDGGTCLETVWEFRPASGGVWREVSLRKIAHRQLYTFILNVDDATYPAARPAFDSLVSTAELSPPNTGADLADPKANRWVQREFKFALDLPAGWSPVLAPSEVALLFANAPASGVWSDNLLVIAKPHGPLDLADLKREYPDQLRLEEPACEVVSCEVARKGERDVLETVVRTTRGPFSMTVLEWRFRGKRLDYEVKFSVESKRFEGLAPALRKSLESFTEVPGVVPGLPRKPA